jgi:hypothetical protein
VSDEERTTAAAILGAARAAMKNPQATSPRRRRYPVLEALVGEVLPPFVEAPVLAFRGEPMTQKTALVRADTTRQALARPAHKDTPAKKLAQRMVQQVKGLSAHKKFQALIERTVKTLLITASKDGDLAFRADIDANVMSDLSVDVMLSPHGLEIAFYTEDTNTRRLLQGYERDLVAHLSSRGLKVRNIRYETGPDPNEAPPVPLKG